MKRNATLLFVVLFGLLAIVGGCSSSGEETKTVTITATDNGWDSQMLHNEIAGLIVENAYDGYRFEVSTGSSTMNWQAIIAGDVDLDIESWTDNVATYEDDKAKGDIIDVGILVHDSAQGLYVPRYVIEGDSERGIKPVAPGLKTVEDLKKYPDVFPDDEDPEKGRIYGSLPGWMADEILYKKYEYYGLDEDFNYVRLGSEATLFASLTAAYNLGEPWVGYCYEPTWVTGKLDLVRLEDAPYDPALYVEGKCSFPEQELKIVSSNKFADKAPDLLEFFKKYKTGSELVSQALAYLDDTGASHKETALWLLKENDHLLDEWLPAENAQKMRAYLDGIDGN
ncbi:MAG: ABC transporter substrate-binding protein [Clostridiales bacterium]|jgi:glycine betaine/proline transport system substrate-binding protein|nr:ABC transporter substrate-binding protein [Clostridiales bacterium]